MKLLSYLRNLLRNIFRRAEVDSALDREVDSYIEMLVVRNLADGMSEREAKRAALLEFGGGQQVKESTREARAGNLLESFLQDLRYAVRTLAKTPGFTAVAVLTLGLGVGANSAIFSVINGVLLRSLPFQNPDRLAVVRTTYNGGPTGVTSWKDFEDFKARSKSFEQMAMYDRGVIIVARNGDASAVQIGVAGSGFFEMFRARPVLGRFFRPQEYQPNAGKVIALTEGYWKQQFGADPKAIGRTLTVDGYQAMIVGIVPDLFDKFMGSVQIWAPLPQAEEIRGSRHLWAAGLLRPGVKINQASSEIAGIADSLQKSYPMSNEGWSAKAMSLRDSIVGDTRQILLILFGVVALVLLVACVNIANLLLARGAARRKEVAVRRALGASRVRLIRQFLAEGLVISLLGGLVALVLAAGAMKILVGIAPPDTPRLSDISLDRNVIGFTAILALAANFVFGLLPAVRLSGTSVHGALHEAGRGVRGDRSQTRLRKLLVVAELAISLMLLIGCGLLVRSLYDLIQVNPGFNPHGVVAAKITFPSETYQTGEALEAFYNRFYGELKSLPAESAAISTTLPLRGGGFESWGSVGREGEPRDSKSTIMTQQRGISSGYFHTMGIPLRAGRAFNEFDKEGGKPVVILSRSLARQLWGNERNAIGKQISYGSDRPVEIVGVAGDVKPWGLEGRGDPGSYFPLSQGVAWPMVVVARTISTGNSDAAVSGLVQSIKNAVQSIDSGVAVYSVKTMDQVVDESMVQRRFYLTLMSVLGGLSFLLAAIGTYGVISFSVAERTQEIGIRMALGASRKEILSLVIGQGCRLAAAGSAVGLVAAIAVTRVIESFLFNVKPRDPLTFAVISAFLISVALAASYLPARTATGIDPNSALKSE